jgi:predicted  nucleic acid-binding Zn-ribbon protein
MANKKKVRCHGCGEVFETEAESIMAPCPKCGMNLKVNRRWEPEGAQYVTPADKDLSKY